MAKRRKPFMAPPIEADTTGRAQAVRAMADLARSDMTTRYQEWREYYEYRQGIQWPVGKRDRAVLNFIFTHFTQAKALLTETIPEPSYEERTTRMKGKAMVMTDWWEQIREGSRYRWVVAECVGNAWTYGTGFERLRWDRTLMPRYGGNMRVESVSPWNVLIEPNALDVDGAMWIIIKSPITRRRIEAYYGKMSDAAWASCRSERSHIDTPERDPLRIDAENQAWQYEAFIMDGRLDYKPLDSIEEMPYGPVPRYMKVIGDCLFQDSISRYEDVIPLIRVVLDPVEDQIWGRSRIPQLKGPQDSANARNHAANEAMRQTAFRKLRVSPSSRAASDQKLTTKSGGIVHAEAGEVDWLTGPGAHPGEQQLIAAAISLMDRLAMIQAAGQGVRPTGITSGVAISQLQQAAMAGVRMQIRMIGDAVRDCAMKLPKLLERFYYMERPVAAAGATLMMNGDVLKGDWGVKVDTKALMASDALGGYEMLLRIVQALGIPPDMIIDKAPDHLINDVEKAQLKERVQMMYQAAAQAEQEQAAQMGAPQGAPQLPAPQMAAAG
jgi:hypothetical protein